MGFNPYGAVLLGDPGKSKIKDKRTGGWVLDKTGRPIFEDDKFNKPGVIFSTGGSDFDYEEARFHFFTGKPELDIPKIIQERAPKHVLENLAKAAGHHRKINLDDIPEYVPMGSNQKWGEGVGVRNNDGTAVTGSSESVMLPIFTLPADYCGAGRWMRWTVFGRQSTAITTPGTITFKLSYSASGTGSVTVATGGAFAPDVTAAATNLTFMQEWWFWVRTDGASGTAMGIGRTEWTDYDDASAAALVANLAMRMAPVSAPATAAIDTTVARSISPTYTSNVVTASMTAHGGILESLT